jgi:hypothetical protein
MQDGGGVHTALVVWMDEYEMKQPAGQLELSSFMNAVHAHDACGGMAADAERTSFGARAEVSHQAAETRTEHARTRVATFMITSR